MMQESEAIKAERRFRLELALQTALSLSIPGGKNSERKSADEVIKDAEKFFQYLNK